MEHAKTPKCEHITLQYCTGYSLDRREIQSWYKKRKKKKVTPSDGPLRLILSSASKLFIPSKYNVGLWTSIPLSLSLSLSLLFCLLSFSPNSLLTVVFFSLEINAGLSACWCRIYLGHTVNLMQVLEQKYLFISCPKRYGGDTSRGLSSCDLLGVHHPHMPLVSNLFSSSFFLSFFF